MEFGSWIRHFSTANLVPYKQRLLRPHTRQNGLLRFYSQLGQNGGDVAKEIVSSCGAEQSHCCVKCNDSLLMVSHHRHHAAISMDRSHPGGAHTKTESQEGIEADRHSGMFLKLLIECPRPRHRTNWLIGTWIGGRWGSSKVELSTGGQERLLLSSSVWVSPLLTLNSENWIAVEKRLMSSVDFGHSEIR